jgi:hypothetical protein
MIAGFNQEKDPRGSLIPLSLITASKYPNESVKFDSDEKSDYLLDIEIDGTRITQDNLNISTGEYTYYHKGTEGPVRIKILSRSYINDIICSTSNK